MYFQSAKSENQFVLTAFGYDHTLDYIKHERAAGTPIRGYENRVPVSWIEKGYVEERSTKGDR